MTATLASPIPIEAAPWTVDPSPIGDPCLYAEHDCPLAALMSLLDALADPTVSSTSVIALAAGLPVEPTAHQLDSLRGWHDGLHEVLTSHRILFRLGETNGSRLAAARFVPLEPVLRAWRADLSLEPDNRAGADWLGQLGWSGLLKRARRRDQAALQIIAGRAELVESSVYANRPMGRHAG